MKMLFNDKIKKSIRKDLSIEDKGDKQSMLSEAYAAQPKQFTLNTDLLSNANINNHIKLYEDYIAKFNRASAELDSIDKSDVNSNHSTYRSVKLDETFNMNGAYLHELYFSNIADPNSQISMDSLSFMRLTRDFGTFDNWQKDFMACALSSRCGWVVTYLNMYTQSYSNCFIDLHTNNVPAGMFPVIVIDMWQHAFYKDYLKDSKTYLSAMMKQLRWSVIEKRIQKADSIIQVLRSSI